MLKISIIVAAFNVEKYILRCVNSVLRQKDLDLELLVVNDGSTDNTLHLLQTIDDKRLIILNKQNGGLSDARNYGLKYAKGDYIAFLDGDDFVEDNMYSILLKKAQENDSDLVECSYYMDYPGCSRIKDISKKINSDNYILPYNAWNKLIKKKIITDNNLSFLNNVWYEDFNFNLKLRPFIKYVSYVWEPLYHYEQRCDSIMHTTSQRVKEIFIVIDDVLEFYRDNGIQIDNIVEYIILKELQISSFKRLIKYDKEHESCYKNLINEYIYDKFPKWRRNKYIRKFKLINLYLLLPFGIKKIILNIVILLEDRRR